MLPFSSLMDWVGWVEVGLVEFIQSTKLGIVSTWAGLGRAELVLVVGVILFSSRPRVGVEKFWYLGGEEKSGKYGPKLHAAVLIDA